MNYKIMVYNICKKNYNVNNLQLKQGKIVEGYKMEYILGLYLLVGALYDGIKKKIPNWWSMIALFFVCSFLALEALITGSLGGKAVFIRLSIGVLVYFLFYLFFCIGAFGGGDGKVAAILAVGVGIDAFLQMFFLSTCFAILYGILKLRRQGYKTFLKRVLEYLKLIGRDGLLVPELLKAESEAGLRIPFVPFVLAGFFMYKILAESGVIG